MRGHTVNIIGPPPLMIHKPGGSAAGLWLRKINNYLSSHCGEDSSPSSKSLLQQQCCRGDFAFPPQNSHSLPLLSSVLNSIEYLPKNSFPLPYPSILHFVLYHIAISPTSIPLPLTAYHFFIFYNKTKVPQAQHIQKPYIKEQFVTVQTGQRIYCAGQRFALTIRKRSRNAEIHHKRPWPSTRKHCSFCCIDIS